MTNFSTKTHRRKLSTGRESAKSQENATSTGRESANSQENAPSTSRESIKSGEMELSRTKKLTIRAGKLFPLLGNIHTIQIFTPNQRRTKKWL